MEMSDNSLPNRALFCADSLDLLERIPSGTVQLMYLDPPFYESNGSATSLTTYLDFLAKCFIQARRILSENGNLALHFEPYYLPYVRLVLDELFGQDNFKNEFILPFTRIFNTENPTFDVIVLYQKSSLSIYNQLYLPLNPEDGKKQYPYEDNKGRYRLVSLFTRTGIQKYTYEWNGIVPPDGHAWKYSLDKLNDLYRNGHISFTLSKGIPSLKLYISESKGKALGSIWNDLPRYISPDERTGYPSQQPIELLWRVIRICTNSGDMVCDPFCGSGTTLVAAEFENRRWIGCDNLKEAVDLSLSRLQRHFRLSNTSITRGNKDTISEIFSEAYSLPDVKVLSAIAKPLRLNLRQKRINRELIPVVSTPLVITEGKTDWKHIKAAYYRLKDPGYIKFDLYFDEFFGPRGGEDLLEMCNMAARLPNHQTRIFIFDRDVEKIINKVSGINTIFKDWGNNVFSFAIPLPEHRIHTPDISIEFYYQDKDIIRKDKQNRRLFLNNEFHPNSGRHKKEDVNCLDLNKLKSKTLKIIDEKVFDGNNKNIALTKDDFAEYIYNGDENFNSLDIFAFAEIFDAIAKIMKYPDGLISIPRPDKTKRNHEIRKQKAQ